MVSVVLRSERRVLFFGVCGCCCRGPQVRASRVVCGCGSGTNIDARSCCLSGSPVLSGRGRVRGVVCAFVDLGCGGGGASFARRQGNLPSWRECIALFLNLRPGAFIPQRVALGW